jgi:hypothetical protein
VPSAPARETGKAPQEAVKSGNCRRTRYPPATGAEGPHCAGSSMACGRRLIELSLHAVDQRHFGRHEVRVVHSGQLRWTTVVR